MSSAAQARNRPRSSTRRALAAGVPIVAGITLLGASSAQAQGPQETKKISAQHIDGLGNTVNCTLTLGIITNYNNNSKQDYAAFDITNVGGCRDASVSQSLNWTTDKGGGTSVSENFGPTSLVPAHVENTYTPVSPTPAQANFTETVSISFDNCTSNCQLFLQLTADGSIK